LSIRIFFAKSSSLLVLHILVFRSEMERGGHLLVCVPYVAKGRFTPSSVEIRERLTYWVPRLLGGS
jgi:hypothetical protein